MADNGLIQLVCVKAFGNFRPGDIAGEVSPYAEYDTDYFQPSAQSAPAVVPAGKKTKAQREAELEAELAALERESAQ